jgi:rhamnosyl/mannosyltransferase
MVFTYYCDLSRQRALLPVYGPLVHALFDRAHVLHAISPTALERRDSLVARDRDRFRVVALGIDVAPLLALDRDRPGARALRERYGDPFLLFVGRLRHYKGLHVLLDAMPHVDANLVVIGDGPKGPELREQARRLGLGERVHFAGAVGDDVLHDHLAAAGIGLLPSSTPTEAFGLAMVESMAAGLPVVSTELGTGTSFVNQDGVTGLIVPANDPPALAAALKWLLADPDLRLRMGAAGRQRVREKFTTEVMMRGMDRLYAEALERAGSPGHLADSGPPGKPGIGGQGLP